MEVYEKINYILQEKNIKKSDFVRELISLNPYLKNGILLKEQTIYRYLNGSRELKVELIPYIAEVLEVSINELFEFDIEYASNFNYRSSRQVKNIINLLQYLPKPTIEKLELQLLNYKKLHENFKI